MTHREPPDADSVDSTIARVHQQGGSLVTASIAQRPAAASSRGGSRNHQFAIAWDCGG